MNVVLVRIRCLLHFSTKAFKYSFSRIFYLKIIYPELNLYSGLCTVTIVTKIKISGGNRKFVNQ